MHLCNASIIYFMMIEVFKTNVQEGIGQDTYQKL
jgi:hypothetical protein